MSFALFTAITVAGALSPLPAPLRGRVGMGVAPGEVRVCGTPTPDPSPQGGGELKRVS
jgi:hypothetical protein